MDALQFVVVMANLVFRGKEGMENEKNDTFMELG